MPPKPFWADRTFYVTAFTIAAALLSPKLGFQLDAGKLADLAVVVSAFILGHKGHTIAALVTAAKAEAKAELAVKP